MTDAVSLGVAEQALSVAQQALATANAVADAGANGTVTRAGYPAVPLLKLIEVTPDSFKLAIDVDDTASIQRAHDEIESLDLQGLGSGQVVGVAGRTYNCSATIVWNLRHVGADWRGCTLNFVTLSSGAALLFQHRTKDNGAANQFGHYEHHFHSFRLNGPARASYVVDAVTPASVYGAITATAAGVSGLAPTGIVCHTPNPEYNPGQATLGHIHNFTITGFTSSIALGTNAYLVKMDHFETFLSCFGIVGVAAQSNSGEFVDFEEFLIHDTQVAWINDGVNYRCFRGALDPAYTLIARLTNASNIYAVDCRWEAAGSPVVPVVSLSGVNTSLYWRGGECTVDALASGSPTTFILTTDATQRVFFEDVLLSNLTVYPLLYSGPGRARIGRMRSYQYANWPADLSDTDTGDYFGANDFNTTVLGAWAPPPIFLNSSGSGLSASTVNSRTSTSLGLVTRNASGTLTPPNGVGYSINFNKPAGAAANAGFRPTFLAAVPRDQLYWWRWYWYVGAAAGTPLYNTLYWVTSFVALQGYDESGTKPVFGQTQFNQNNSFSLPKAGSTSWTRLQSDIFNHGLSQCPTWATHFLFQIVLDSIDMAANTGFNGGFNVAGVRCFGM